MSYELNPIDYWKFSKELSIVQASLLIIGKDPSEYQEYIDDWEYQNRPDGYDAIISALKYDIISGNLSARIARNAEHVIIKNQDGEDVGTDWIPDSTINLHETTVSVEDLKTWLKSNGVTDCFFYTAEDEVKAKYLETSSKFYAPKLAGAVKAWEYITQNPKLLKNTSPKEAIKKWLRENATIYGLTKDDGNPNEQGIEEIAKVANWKMGGGVPKTNGTPENIKQNNKNVSSIQLPIPSKVNPPTPQKPALNIQEDETSEDYIPF